MYLLIYKKSIYKNADKFYNSLSILNFLACIYFGSLQFSIVFLDYLKKSDVIKQNDLRIQIR